MEGAKSEHVSDPSGHKAAISTVAGSLPPRARETLLYLLDGMSEKEVARAMCVSRHTVHAHVKYVYRHFAVSTRAELLSRILRGGATDSGGLPRANMTPHTER